MVAIEVSDDPEPSAQPGGSLNCCHAMVHGCGILRYQVIVHARPSIIGIVICSLLHSCGTTSKRDLRSTPPRNMTFNDMCHLQMYFDQRNPSHPRAFRVLEESTSEVELAVPSEDQGPEMTRRVTRGEGQYQVSDRPARVRLQQLLQDEYSNLPELGLTNPNARIRVRASWYLTTGQVRRLLPDNMIEIQGPMGTATLPFNPCVGEFLFGAEVYRGRRRFLDDDAARAAGRDAPSVLEEQARLRALELQMSQDSAVAFTTDAAGD